MTQKRFNSLTILNFHKQETDRIDLVSVRNDFIAKHHERYSTFQKFSESGFSLMQLTYSPVPNCRGLGLTPVFGRKQHWGALYYVRLLKGFSLKIHLPEGFVGPRQHLWWDSFWYWLTGFFVNGQFPQILGKIAWKSVETVRSQKNP